MNELWIFMLIWGVWILMPILVDGADTVIRLFVVLIWGRNHISHSYTDDELPNITILVPAYNEEQVIDRCLNSIKIQDYPHDKMEVIVINDGSNDLTADKVMRHIDGRDSGKRDLENHDAAGTAPMPGTIPAGIFSTKDLITDDSIKPSSTDEALLEGRYMEVPKFRGDMTLVNNHHYGKPTALNSGISQMNGSQIIFTVDSDVVLDPQAVREMVYAFLDDPKLGAATGHIEISDTIVEERDELGNLVLDKDGHLMSKKMNFLETALTRLQFLEYLDAFRLGRQFQATVGSAYILAGAFSAFRRTTLMKTQLYKPRTVSEDFDLTVDIHETGEKVGYVSASKALLTPVIMMNGLYSQRVRWCRGELEVAGAHANIIGNRDYGMIGLFGLPSMLIIDHTLSFPRLIWTILILLFPFFGYPVSTVVLALLLTYGFYIGLSFIQTFAAYTIVDGETKRQTERALGWCFVLPIYRLVVFYFRMSGYLRTLNEPAGWSVESPSLMMTGDRFNIVKNKALAAGLIAGNLAKVGITQVRSIAIMFLSMIAK